MAGAIIVSIKEGYLYLESYLKGEHKFNFPYLMLTILAGMIFGGAIATIVEKIRDKYGEINLSYGTFLLGCLGGGIVPEFFINLAY